MDTWQELHRLQKRWKPFIELQFVALVPLEHWSTEEGGLFASQVSEMGGLLGGVLVPPFQKKEAKNSPLSERVSRKQWVFVSYS